MSLFGPTKLEMTDAVADGIHKAIRTTKSHSYDVKQSKVAVKGDYHVIPPDTNIVALDQGMPIMPPPRKIRVPGHYIIFDVIYRETQKRHNPFTDVTESSVVYENNVGRYYSYDGWTVHKIHQLIEFAYRNGYYPSDEYLEELALRDKNE